MSEQKVILIAGGGKFYADIAARFCRSEKPIEQIIESPYSPQIIQNLIDAGHSAALEFDYFLFAVEGFSRVCETQLVRKRIASYMIKSGREELGGKRKFDVLIPESVKDFSVSYPYPLWVQFPSIPMWHFLKIQAQSHVRFVLLASVFTDLSHVSGFT